MSQQQHAHKSRKEHTKTTQWSHSSKTRSNLYLNETIAWLQSLGVVGCSMGAWCSMRLGVPFIAPRDLGAIGAPFGRLWLPFVCGCTGLSGAQRIVNRHGQRIAWLVGFLFWGHRTILCTTSVFGLRNKLVHHLLTPHYFCLVCGMEWVDPSPPHSS
jgi:hypothetical protein